MSFDTCDVIIRNMAFEDWNKVFEIYKQGIDSGKTTFTTAYPIWEEWDATHIKTCRYVAVYNDKIIGFVAVSPVSNKSHYSGVVEVMVYVEEQFHNNGVGTILLEKLIEEAPKIGIWCLYSSIFSTNENSIKLHNKCGFRTIGYRERIAKDKFGNWTDTTLMEYRFPDNIVKE